MMHIISEHYGVRCPGRFEFYWKKWSLAAELIFTGDDGDEWPWMIHLHFLPFGLFLHFPLKFTPPSKRERWMREWQRWGFSLCDDAVHFHWNERTEIWNLPWFSSVHQRHEVRRADGSWAPFIGSWEPEKGQDGREEFVYPYAYKLRSGQIQDRTATVFVERRAWRPKGLTWTGLFEKQRQSIDVQFDDEVGERTGSWKGGCVGCGWDMLPDEGPEQTLRRMEAERKF